MASSYSTRRIEHANHNYEAYLYLSRAEGHQFLGVVTTAYYSANHYAKGKIFPHIERIKDKEQTFETFEDYFNTKFGGSSRVSLHKTLIDLAYIDWIILLLQQ